RLSTAQPIGPFMSQPRSPGQLVSRQHLHSNIIGIIEGNFLSRRDVDRIDVRPAAQHSADLFIPVHQRHRISLFQMQSVMHSRQDVFSTTPRRPVDLNAKVRSHAHPPRTRYPLSLHNLYIRLHTQLMPRRTEDCELSESQQSRYTRERGL